MTRPPAPLAHLACAPTRSLAARDVARRGTRVAIVALIIGLVMSYATGRVTLAGLHKSVVYSVCISLCSWALIEAGSLLFRPDPQTGWPSGGRGLLVSVLGCLFGFALGSALADLVMGWPVYSAYTQGLRSLKADLIGSMAIGAGFSGYFYLRGQTEARQTQLARAERDLSLARLTLLQSQLEPHMMFNTLANLRVLIGLDPARAQDMLDRLIAYLRATLSASRSAMHPLSAEFARLDDYLALMKVRMGERLQVSLTLPPELAEWPVPPLLLQPIAENAIQHGLEPQRGPGGLWISAQLEGERLCLSVRDSGRGLDPDAPPRPGGGFGLSQVRERLATLYGEAAELTLAPSPEGKGTLVTVRLPRQALIQAPNPTV